MKTKALKRQKKGEKWIMSGKALNNINRNAYRADHLKPVGLSKLSALTRVRPDSFTGRKAYFAEGKCS
jgi:hypothetical protein